MQAPDLSADTNPEDIHEQWVLYVNQYSNLVRKILAKRLGFNSCEKMIYMPVCITSNSSC
jgi:hypothetical protein